MQREIIFKIQAGAVDDFRIAPSPCQNITVSEIRENAITDCLRTLNEYLSSRIKGDESLISWHIEEKE